MSEQPDDRPDIRELTYRNLVELVSRCVAFELIAGNIDRPDADKYGTHPNGKPRYAPAWYVAQGIQTGIHEALYGVLSDTLRCLSTADDGVLWCIGALSHDGVHWDGNGANWLDDGTVMR